MYQCADTQRIAFGFGSFAPIAAHCSVWGFRSRAFIGFPWPKKTDGIRRDMVRSKRINELSAGHYEQRDILPIPYDRVSPISRLSG